MYKKVIWILSAIGIDILSILFFMFSVSEKATKLGVPDIIYTKLRIVLLLHGISVVFLAIHVYNYIQQKSKDGSDYLLLAAAVTLIVCTLGADYFIYNITTAQSPSPFSAH